MSTIVHDNGTVQFTFFLVMGLNIYIVFSSLNIENGLFTICDSVSDYLRIF